MEAVLTPQLLDRGFHPDDNCSHARFVSLPGTLMGLVRSTPGSRSILPCHAVTLTGLVQDNNSSNNNACINYPLEPMDARLSDMDTQVWTPIAVKTK
jgi:hypothetical protein